MLERLRPVMEDFDCYGERSGLHLMGNQVGVVSRWGHSKTPAIGIAPGLEI